MSQNASFYTFDKKMSGALLQAAVPQRQTVEKKILFFSRKVEQTVDNFWKFLQEQATAQENFGYSGTGFTDLELLLEENGVDLYKFGSGGLAGKLAAVRPSVVAVFDSLAAQNTIKMLNEIKITAAEAQIYCQENFPQENEALMAEAIISAEVIFKRWLGSVGETQLGLLLWG